MNFEYPIHPERTYRITVDDEKYYITGENLIALVLDKLAAEWDNRTMRKLFAPIKTYLQRRDELMMRLGERRYRDKLIDFVETRMENGIIEAEDAEKQGYPETASYLSGAVAACNAIIRTARRGQL